MRKLTIEELKQVSGGDGCGPSLGGFVAYLFTHLICCNGVCNSYQ